jgi:peptidyl-dipeptidase Dcp
MAESAEVVVRVEAESELDGLPEAMRVAAAKLAERKGHPGQWAIANARPAVWPVLQFATHRGLRRRVRDMWMNRCAYDGPFDNRPVIAEILKLRGEKARLLGYPSFAHWATAGRMAGTPDAALDQMLRTWRPVREETNRRLAELQVLADADGLDGPIEAWDWLFYMERLRRQRFGLDGNAVKPYLQLDNVLRAVMDAAGRLHGLQSRELDGLPTIHPDVRVFEVSREGDPLGVIWLDLLARDGKMRGSWQYELRAAESFRGRTIGLSNVCSSLERTGDGGPVLMGWEYANVLFHEFGHALHMIMSRARYPSLGSMAVAWDLVEVPSQLNERWLRDRELLRRYAVHVETGEPMPDAMIDAIEAAAQFDRVVSVGLEYLAPAIVDMRIHLAADGSDVDALRIEREVYAELGMPAALDAIMRLPHQYHSFTDVYAAGLYVYLWADVMVAELLGAFAGAPGGLYDEQVARRYRDTILCVGHSVKGQEAFRNFLGRDPDPDALLRRFRLA